MRVRKVRLLLIHHRSIKRHRFTPTPHLQLSSTMDAADEEKIRRRQENCTFVPWERDHTIPATPLTLSCSPEVTSGPHSAPPFERAIRPKRPTVKLPASQPITKSDFRSSPLRQQLKRKHEDDATPTYIVRRKISEAPRSEFVTISNCEFTDLPV